jgi:hypothetical protein
MILTENFLVERTNILIWGYLVEDFIVIKALSFGIFQNDNKGLFSLLGTLKSLSFWFPTTFTFISRFHLYNHAFTHIGVWLLCMCSFVHVLLKVAINGVHTNVEYYYVTSFLMDMMMNFFILIFIIACH